MSEPVTLAELDEMERRARAAPKGPWIAEDDFDNGKWHISLIRKCDTTADVWLFGRGESGPPFADSLKEDLICAFNLCAHARTDLPRLIASYRQAIAERDRLDGLLKLSAKDWAEDDTEIKRICKPYFPGEDVESNNGYFLSAVEVVEATVESLSAEVSDLRRQLAEARPTNQDWSKP